MTKIMSQEKSAKTTTQFFYEYNKLSTKCSLIVYI